MKRTITEIFIEVEETIAVRQTAKSAAAGSAVQTVKETTLCPLCKQLVPANENLLREDEKKDEN
jgi:hypothetical protein